MSYLSMETQQLKITLPQQSHQPHFEASPNSKSRPQLRHKLSYGDLLSSQPPVNKPRVVRRSRSEFRPQIIDRNNEINPLNLHQNHNVIRKTSQRDYNGNCNLDTSNSDYAELSPEKKFRNSRPQHNVRFPRVFTESTRK